MVAGRAAHLKNGTLEGDSSPMRPQPLAKAGVSVFAISTFDADYQLVTSADLPRAITALGHKGPSIR